MVFVDQQQHPQGFLLHNLSHQSHSSMYVLRNPCSPKITSAIAGFQFIINQRIFATAIIVSCLLVIGHWIFFLKLDLLPS